MSRLRSGGAAGDAVCRDAGTLRAARWLSLAASPTFAMMAILSAAPGIAPADALCSTSQASPLSGMTLMYALMSAFHVAPWLRRFQ